MCMNKYAQKVIEESSSAVLFSPGQVAAVRTANRLDMSPTDNREREEEKLQFISLCCKR